MITSVHVELSAPALNVANLLVSLGLPLLVAIITKRVTAPHVKQIILAVLTVLTGALTTIVQNGGSFDLTDTLLGVLTSYVVAQGGYTLVLKPGGVANAVAKASDAVGLGAVIVPADTPPTIASGTVTSGALAGGTITINGPIDASIGGSLSSGSNSVGYSNTTAPADPPETPEGPAGLFGEGQQPDPQV